MRRLWVACTMVLAVAGCARRSHDERQSGADGSRSRVLPAAAPPSHLGSASCATCHPAAAAAHRTSHHALAERPASPETVHGDFGGRELAVDGVIYRFTLRDGRHVVQERSKGASVVTTHAIERVIGVWPLEQYLVRAEGGRLQAFPLAWDTRSRELGGQRWFSLSAGQRLAPGDELHWTGRRSNWNQSCAECHTTEYRTGYDAQTSTFASSFAELGVGCEACHGPGSAHVEWVRGGSAAPRPPRAGLPVDLGRGRARWIRATGEPTARPVGAEPDQAELETCARCHSRRTRLNEGPHLGRPFLEEHLPDLVLPPAYYVDGQVREEAFEWGAFLQSKMHRRGVTCGDCHDAHSGRLRASASATCAQCHDPGTFAQREHHGHAPEGPGAECVECHMPPTVFMGVHRRHDHSFRVPRPDLSVEYGVPNACTTCHDDRSASWALASLSAPVRARISGRSTSAGAFAGATAGDVAAAATLVEFARQKADSSPLLAASAWTLRARLGLQMAASDLAEELGRSESPLIQLGLLTTLELFPVHERAALAPRAPGGPRAVRLAWLSALAPARAALSPAGQADLRLLIGELRAHTARRAEDPAAQVLLGEVLLDAGDPRGAREPLRAALTLEPGYPPAAALLALAEEGLQNVDAAREVLERARARHPREPGLVLALAELEVRAGRRERALHLLAEGVQSHPDHADLTYLYLVAMAESQMSPATLRAVRTARSRFPQHDGIRILDTELSARPRTTGGAW